MVSSKIRIRWSSQAVRYGLYSVMAVLLITAIGLTAAYPIPSEDETTSANPTDEQAIVLFDPLGLVAQHDADLENQIRTSKKIILVDRSAFDRTARIHEILSKFQTGLTVDDQERLAKLIYEESLRYGYDPELIVSVILTESSFYQRAYSRKGAVGLMQLLPPTGRALAKSNRISLNGTEALYDPHLNIKLGTQYLALLHQRFGDLGLALVAYNHGPTRVAEMMDRGERLPTRYTQKVLHRYKQLLHQKPDNPIQSSKAVTSATERHTG